MISNPTVPPAIPVRIFAKRFLKSPQTMTDPSHRAQFENAGYIGVDVNPLQWVLLHTWLRDNCPRQYSWTGSTFWFDDSKIATEFALRFA